MLRDIIDFVDRDYGTVRKDTRLSSNQLRTRPSSFKSIYGHFHNWYISRVAKKLEQEKQSLLKEQFEADASGNLTKSAMDKLTKKTECIARLEEKVMILSRENVPSTFRANHAIKLRNKMFANLVKNGSSAYSVGADKYDKVFTDIPVVETPPVVPPVVDEMPAEAMAAAADTSVDTDNQVLNSNDIRGVVEQAFEQVKNSGGITQISPEKVAEAVRPLTDSIVEESVPAEVEIPTSVVTPEPETVQENVTVPVVDEEVPDIQGSINSVFESAADSLGDNKVSHNNSIVARVNHFDHEGNPSVKETTTETVQNVVPEMSAPKTTQSEGYQNLSEEEINAAIEDLASHRILSSVPEDEIQRSIEREIEERFTVPDDSVLKSIEREISERFAKQNDDRVRDFVVVTPDRSLPPKKEVIEEQVTEAKEVAEPEQDIHFDYSDVTPRDVAKAVEHETSRDGFEALRLRVEELQVRQRKTKKAMEDAERMAENAAERAWEARRIAEEKQAQREAWIEKLREYEEALAEDCAINEGRTRIAIGDAQCNERFIEAQEASAQESDSLIEEIDSLISPEAVNVRGR